ncbi:retrovirus-related pol polyprotein from transposon TNT 1-94, partial [Tanacetum coccineum]
MLYHLHHLRKSQRTRTIPTKLKDFQHYQPSSTNSVITKHHTSHFINYNNIQNPTTLHFINSITHETEPNSYTQASKNPKWVEAMNNEISALESNHTRELTTLPHNKHAIGYKWVFRIKYNANGSIDKYKARLVAKGFNQQEGIDYTKTFAHVANDLHEEVYMKVPSGYKKALPPNTVCKLKKSLSFSLQDSSWKAHLPHYQQTIAFAAQLLRQSSQNPHTSHLQALTRVIRYLKLSPGQGLFFPKVNYPVLHAYCDSDWASCPSSRRPSLWIWYFSRQQSYILKSNQWFLDHQLYRALVDCSCEITWLCSLLKDLKVIVPKPVRILCDNISTIALASNPIQHARTKHMLETRSKQ